MTEERRLDEVATIVMGQAPSGESYNIAGDGWPLIAGAGDFKEGQPVPLKFTTRPSKLSEPGDVILSIRASIGDKVTADNVYCLGRGVAGIRATDSLLPRYLWHWLTGVEDELASKGRGATFKQVNREDIGELRIPLPPLAEQRRIAEVLDQADESRAKRRKSISLLDELVQSSFLEMFGDPIYNPNNWPIEYLGMLGQVQGGLQVTAKRQGLPLEVPYLRVANVYRNRLDLREIKMIKVTAHELDRTRLRNGDLLIVEGHGNSEEIGRAAQWDGSIADCVHQNHLIRVRLGDEVLPGFACMLLNSDGGRVHLLRSANTTSGLNTISSSDVRSVPVMVPPLAMQSQFVTRVSHIRELQAIQQRSLTELNELSGALRTRAFRGEL